MGNKINPLGFRLGITRDWNSRWYAGKGGYAKLLLQDEQIRKLIPRIEIAGSSRDRRVTLKEAGLAKIEIERTGQQVNVIISAAKPGVLIGRNGETIKKVREAIERLIGGVVAVNVAEIHNINTNAALVAQRVAEQIERRFAFRRAMKQAAQRVMENGARGVKVILSGRLGGAEQARTEKVLDGRVPLHTLRADIDYGTALATTTYGIIGIKVLVFNGEKIGKADVVRPAPQRPSRDDRGNRGGGDRNRSRSGGGGGARRRSAGPKGSEDASS